MDQAAAELMSLDAMHTHLPNSWLYLTGPTPESGRRPLTAKATRLRDSLTAALVAVYQQGRRDATLDRAKESLGLGLPTLTSTPRHPGDGHAAKPSPSS
jgi:hypothetical protein